MDNCIFCKIISGEIPAHKIYEDDNTLAFLDIAPVNPGHILIIPKKHYANMEDIPENDLTALMKTAKKIGSDLKNKLKIEGYNIQINNDPVAGQVIPHLHIHVIPRKKGDGLKLWQQGKYKEGEAEKITEKLRN